MEALHDVVRAGKVRYLGASSMAAWQFATMQHAADLGGWTRFVSMQDHYNLLMREEEREMFPLLAHQGVGSIPWSPLARGRLARPWDATTDRVATDEFGKTLYQPDDARIVAAVAGGGRAARGLDGRGSPRVGAAQPGGRLPDRRCHQGPPPHRRRGRVRRPLSEDDAAELEAAYTPRVPVGYAHTGPTARS